MHASEVHNHDRAGGGAIGLPQFDAVYTIGCREECGATEGAQEDGIGADANWLRIDVGHQDGRVGASHI